MKKKAIKPKQNKIDFLLPKAGEKDALDMFDFSVPAGAKVPVTYYHEQLNETAYGLERIITFTVEAKAIDTAPGETHFIPVEAVNGVAV